MSATSSTVTPEHFAYLAARTRPEPPLRRELRQAAGEAGIPAIWIAPEQASLLQILLKLAGAREVVEVGTLAGYSALAMAEALPPGGRVRTIELDPARADFAERWIARADLAATVEVHRGAGATVLAGFADRSADAMFLDADKAGYPAYLRQALRIVRPGGMVLVDNAFAFGQLLDERPTDPEVGAVRAFNDEMARTAGLHGIILPIGDGLWVAVVEGAG